MKDMTMNPIHSKPRFSCRMMLICAALSVAAVSGCATAPGAAQSPAQVVAQACLVVQATNASLAALPGLTPTARANLEQAVPIISAVCAPGAPVDVSSLQALASTAFPALLKIADAAGLPVADHDRIVDELAVGQLALNLALISAGKAPVLLPPAAPALQVTVPLVPALPSAASVPQ